MLSNFILKLSYLVRKYKKIIILVKKNNGLYKQPINRFKYRPTKFLISHRNNRVPPPQTLSFATAPPATPPAPQQYRLVHPLLCHFLTSLQIFICFANLNLYIHFICIYNIQAILISMLLRPNARIKVRRSRYKVAVDAEEGWRRREDNMVEIRRIGENKLA